MDEKEVKSIPPLADREARETYFRLLAYLKPYRSTFTLALLSMAVYGATDGIVPYLLKRVLDDVFGKQDKGMLNLLVLVIVIFAFIRGFFGFFQRYLSASVGLSVVKDIRNQINNKLLRLSPAFFQLHSTGSLIARVTNDTLLVRTALTDAAAAVLRDSIRVFALLIVAFYLDPVLALIAFVGFPIALLPMMKFGKKVRRLSRAGQDQFGGLTGLLQETIVGHGIVQSFTREDYEHQRFENENEKLTETFLKAEKYGALSTPSNEVLASMATAAVILYGGLTVITGVRTQGDFIAFITSMFLLYEPVKKMSRFNTVIQLGVAAAERIFEILDTPSSITEKPEAAELVVDKPKIVYQDVSFAYETDGNTVQWAVRNISLTINPGKTVALVGMSGGGKTTIVTLLSRFYDPQQGAISIDGVDIRDVTLQSLRRSIAVVSQHTFLFNDSVYQNIAYGRPGASAAEIEEAARAANAHDFIGALPAGYHTVIGEQGLKLSGGERARIAIARALLKNAPILVLDEATASLDSEAEGLVQEAIDRLMVGRTVLVIAHRLATIRNADVIAVIVNGKLVESGNHEELLGREGEYSKLYRLQFSAQTFQEENKPSSAGLVL